MYVNRFRAGDGRAPGTGAAELRALKQAQRGTAALCGAEIDSHGACSLRRTRRRRRWVWPDPGLVLSSDLLEAVLAVDWAALRG